MRNLCLLAAVLMLTACVTSQAPSTLPTKLPLDSSLAEDCRQLTKPGAADYDVWQGWIINEVLPAYVDCASKHKRTVQAWPK